MAEAVAQVAVPTRVVVPQGAAVDRAAMVAHLARARANARITPRLNPLKAVANNGGIMADHPQSSVPKKLLQPRRLLHTAIRNSTVRTRAVVGHRGAKASHRISAVTMGGMVDVTTAVTHNSARRNNINRV